MIECMRSLKFQNVSVTLFSRTKTLKLNSNCSPYVKYKTNTIAFVKWSLLYIVWGQQFESTATPVSKQQFSQRVSNKNENYCGHLF